MKKKTTVKLIVAQFVDLTVHVLGLVQYMGVPCYQVNRLGRVTPTFSTLHPLIRLISSFHPLERIIKYAAFAIVMVTTTISTKTRQTSTKTADPTKFLQLPLYFSGKI